MKRFLKKSGVFRITCPDIDILYRAYKRNDIEYFRYIYKNLPSRNEISITQFFLSEFATSLSVFSKNANIISDNYFSKLIEEDDYESGFNKIIKRIEYSSQEENSGNHVNWWNHNKLESFLYKAGFSKIIKSGYNQSTIPILSNKYLFDNTHPEMALYIEAIK